MKNLLFPHQFQLIGWILFIPALVAGALICFGALPLTGIAESVVNDTVIISIALGALFIVCSKERNEDEMTQSIRLASLLNSLYVYVILLVACTIAINGIAFVWFSFINLGLFPIVFVCNFKLEMRRYNKLSDNE